MGNCIIGASDAPHLDANGQPEIRMMVFPAAEAEIIDTWSVSGLRGSGSHDVAVHDLFVPQERTTAFGLESPTQPGPLYVFPAFGLLAISVASVALGIARGSMDCLMEVARHKIPTGGRRHLSERPMIQIQVAQAEAQLRAARTAVGRRTRDMESVAQGRSRLPAPARPYSARG